MIPENRKNGKRETKVFWVICTNPRSRNQRNFCTKYFVIVVPTILVDTLGDVGCVHPSVNFIIAYSPTQKLKPTDLSFLLIDHCSHLGGWNAMPRLFG